MLSHCILILVLSHCILILTHVLFQPGCQPGYVLACLQALAMPYLRGDEQEVGLIKFKEDLCDGQDGLATGSRVAECQLGRLL